MKFVFILIMRKQILEELCNGNFISTQSIMIKSSLIKNNLFDINFPRLQDYDLVLILYFNLSLLKEY